MSRIYLGWTQEELDFLKSNYGKLSTDTIIASLRNRKWGAILKKANKLGLEHSGFGAKKADLSILLHDNPITYYWIGFLLADGSFTERRLSLSVAGKDIDHLKKFMAYVGSTNSIQEPMADYFRVQLTNVKTVSRLRAKFGITNCKTYEPCNLDVLPKNDLLFALVIGFIDGDGSISKAKHTKNAYTISVVGHASWLTNFSLMKKFLTEYFSTDKELSSAWTRELQVKLPQNSHTTLHHLAYFSISYRPLIFQMKQRADDLGLPYLKRKFGKIAIG